MLKRLHAKLGDFWWYSLMIFVACRSGDAIQAFIGLWLVPKYVGPEELGAVLPLQQLAGLFSVPLAILATVFAKYVNVYATRGDYGKVKGFIRDVLGASVALFAVCIAVAYLVVPFFYERLNVASGMLTVLILAAGFASNLASLFTSALQGLKMFKTITVQSLVSAPIRLVTLLVAMPIRALSGYILGQATPPATCSLLAAVSLRRRLAACPCDTTWRRDLPEILKYLSLISINAIPTAVCASIQLTIYRQRLPEVESSAFYILSRLAEITSYFGCSVFLTLFPVASEAHERGHSRLDLLKKTLVANFLVTSLMAIAFAILANPILNVSETWRPYLPYSGLLPWLAFSSGLGAMVLSILVFETASRHFSVIYATLLINVLWTIILVAFTGYSYFDGIFPVTWVVFMQNCRLARLSTLTYSTLAVQLFQFILAYAMLFMRPSGSSSAASSEKRTSPHEQREDTRLVHI